MLGGAGRGVPARSSATKPGSVAEPWPMSGLPAAGRSRLLRSPDGALRAISWRGSPWLTLPV